MKVLMDTHTFIWWDQSPTKLSRSVLEILREEENTRLLSIVTIWELQIKVQLKKLQLRKSIQEVVSEQLHFNATQILSIYTEHIFALEKLPNLPDHRDPFDRLLVAQAFYEQIPILSIDPKFSQYPITVIW